MKIEVKEYNDVTVLAVKGNMMGGEDTVAVHEKVKQLISEKRIKVVIDLSSVKWMNSSGLGTLMGCMTSLKNAEGELKLCGVTEKVKSLFMITKLMTIFDTYETVEDAVEAF